MLGSHSTSTLITVGVLKTELLSWQADREKQLSIVFRWELTKTRSVEAECIEARKATMF